MLLQKLSYALGLITLVLLTPVSASFATSKVLVFELPNGEQRDIGAGYFKNGMSAKIGDYVTGAEDSATEKILASVGIERGAVLEVLQIRKGDISAGLLPTNRLLHISLGAGNTRSISEGFFLHGMKANIGDTVVFTLAGRSSMGGYFKSLGISPGDSFIVEQISH